MDTFEIKPGYQFNFRAKQPMYAEEEHLVYQISVYDYALKKAKATGATSVLDVGCGLGLKLDAFFRPTGINITGVDTEPTIALCRERHDFGCWISDDIEQPHADLGGPFDMIICADVIEHLDDPDHLLRYFRRYATKQTRIILSTPERDLRRGQDHMGPPPNGAHVREWNRDELARYLTSRGMRIEDHPIVALRDEVMTCQLVQCRVG